MNEPLTRSSSRMLVGAVAAVGLTAGLVGGGLGGGGVALARQLTHQSATSSPTGTSSASTVNASTSNGISSAPGTDVERVARAVTPSVVLLKVTGHGQTDEGSGIILSSNGTILTNNHVVAAAAQGGTITAELSSGKSYHASVVGRDPTTDLALVKAAGASGLTPASIGQSADLQVGQPVIAIGAPLGLQGTVTNGIVSALNRPVTTSGDGLPTVSTDAIQTDAPINPGNSGGPLVDAAGRVIGINSAIASLGSTTGTQPGSIGLGFAIPIDQAMRIVHEIEAGDPITHAQLGVSVADSTNPAGAKLAVITPGSAAASAGLKVGDVITGFDQQEISNADALVAAVHAQAPDAKVTLTYERSGSTHTISLTLGNDQTTT